MLGERDMGIFWFVLVGFSEMLSQDYFINQDRLGREAEPKDRR